jgi:hypothetical protein
MVRLLLEHGADPNVYTFDRLSALKTAATMMSDEFMLLLLEHGADPNYEKDDQVALTLAMDPYILGYHLKDFKLPIKSILALLPMTDPKYYQMAYTYAFDLEIRQAIREHVFQNHPKIILTDPVDGFGGPNYRKHLLDMQPPTGKMCKAVWDLIIYLERNFSDRLDPNDFMCIWDLRMLIRDTNQEATLEDIQKLFPKGFHLLSYYLQNIHKCNNGDENDVDIDIGCEVSHPEEYAELLEQVRQMNDNY